MNYRQDLLNVCIFWINCPLSHFLGNIWFLIKSSSNVMVKCLKIIYVVHTYIYKYTYTRQSTGTSCHQYCRWQLDYTVEYEERRRPTTSTLSAASTARIFSDIRIARSVYTIFSIGPWINTLVYIIYIYIQAQGWIEDEDVQKGKSLDA